MEVAPFFVDFHHFLSIFTIFCRFSPFFCRFSRFTHFCRDLHSVEIYALFPPIFLAKIAIPATSHVFSMYDSECTIFVTEEGDESRWVPFETTTATSPVSWFQSLDILCYLSPASLFKTQQHWTVDCNLSVEKQCVRTILPELLQCGYLVVNNIYRGTTTRAPYTGGWSG